MSRIGELARTSAVVQPCPERGSLVVTGSERLSWLDGLVTCAVKTLAHGQGGWGLSLNRQGKIQTELWMVSQPDALWLSLAPGKRDAALADLDRMLIMEDAELATPTSERTWLALHGPEASELAATLAHAHRGFAAPVDWLGLGGAALCLPAEECAAALEGVRDRRLSAEDWLELRLERGWPELAVDYDERDRPHEAALDRRAIDWNKGCYLGQEVVCMQDMRGKVRRSNRVLGVDAPRSVALKAGQDVVDESAKVVGVVRSAAYSSVAGRWLAMCRLELGALERELAVQAEGRHRATLAEAI